MTPVVLSLCELISMNPLPLLLMELFASNIGGRPRSSATRRI
ncbi:MAG: hypothetical protein ACLUEQ_07660 [Cloacibacillus evryensis]